MKTPMLLACAAVALLCTAARSGTITLPAGTQLHVVLETTLTTKTTKMGDPFRARLVVPVFANGLEALPMGTAVTGTVVSLKDPGRVKGRAEMQLRPDMIYLPDGRDISLGATVDSAKTDGDERIDRKEGTVKAGSKDGISAGKTAKGAAAGAGVGAIAGGGAGAAIGAGAAGAIALIHHTLKKGKDASLPAGSELVLEITRPVSFSDMQEVPPQRVTNKTD
ncbi:MAG: hypothetical protein HYX72_08255 [Acidobacteria bacterium]|nr:hypothetical protein [Acidobacteriota bacterium]